MILTLNDSLSRDGFASRDVKTRDSCVARDFVARDVSTIRWRDRIS